jgi:hypothetical protein
MDSRPGVPKIDFSKVILNPPHSVYDLRADEIAKGGGLETAHLTAQRYLIKGPSGYIAAAEVQLDNTGAATLLANINFGPFVGPSGQALDDLAALDIVKQGSYEARMLRFSAIQVLAIWLKSDGAGADIIYPLSPAPAFLQAGKTYSVGDFLNQIRPYAQKRAAPKERISFP